MKHAPTCRKKASVAGFTLIELLAAITILLVIVWVMARIFTESDRAWNFGTGLAESSIEARAALHMIDHDMQYAIVDPSLTFVVRPATERALEVSNPSTIVTQVYESAVHELCMVSMQHDSSDDNRAAREIHYWIRPMAEDNMRFELVRGYYGEALKTNPYLHCYHNANWYKSGGSNPGRPGSAQVIAENVIAFQTHVNYAQFSDTNVTVAVADHYISQGANNYRLPESVDVTIEVMPEREAKELVLMMAAPPLKPHVIPDFIERNAKRFSARIYLHNRIGYRSRGGIW